MNRDPAERERSEAIDRTDDRAHRDSEDGRSLRHAVTDELSRVPVIVDA
jgi:hypothetical protein